jgi:hypothetical protein
MNGTLFFEASSLFKNTLTLHQFVKFTFSANLTFLMIIYYSFIILLMGNSFYLLFFFPNNKSTQPLWPNRWLQIRPIVCTVAEASMFIDMYCQNLRCRLCVDLEKREPKGQSWGAAPEEEMLLLFKTKCWLCFIGLICVYLSEARR